MAHSFDVADWPSVQCHFLDVGRDGRCRQCDAFEDAFCGVWVNAIQGVLDAAAGPVNCAGDGVPLPITCLRALVTAQYERDIDGLRGWEVASERLEWLHQ